MLVATQQSSSSFKEDLVLTGFSRTSNLRVMFKDIENYLVKIIT